MGVLLIESTKHLRVLNMFSNKFYLNPDKDYCPATIGQYKGKIVIVDALNRIYKQTIGLLQKNEYDEVLHIDSIFRFATGLIKFGMLPVFVFDGKSPKEKSSVIAKRINDRKINELKCDELDNHKSDEYLKHYKKKYHLNTEKIDDCKKVLNLLGICYIDSPEEADVQCASLAHYLSDHIGGVITDDYDVLMYGAPIILKDFSFKNSKTMEIEKDYVLKYLHEKANIIRSNMNKSEINEFTHIDFVRFSVLIGTDYSVDQEKPFKVDGISIEKLFEIFVLNDLSIHKVADYLSNMKLIDSKEIFISSWIKITNIYTNSRVIDPEKISIVLDKIDKDNLINFLCDEKKLDKDFVNSELEKIKQNYQVLKSMYNDHHNLKNFPAFKHCQFRHHTKMYLTAKYNHNNDEKELINNNAQYKKRVGCEEKKNIFNPKHNIQYSFRNR